MSTSGSFGYINNNITLLLYNNYDSYPSSLGTKILTFIGKANLNEKWDVYKKDVDTLFKDICSINEDIISINNNHIKDSLFCEFAYIINLDNMTLEFYKGGQKKPQINNRFGCNLNNYGYYPCRLICIFTINKINDYIDICDIIDKMNYISKNNEDDISVKKYFRKNKINEIYKKSLS